ncbi:ankyrin repeat-containing domain protein [Vararia minispora EC-137]|uniref:Ankyrin repeat-containing domain protein n=1 Tax=Vararia minispora EC-137 TaxID=1314806 RepID=A0ACB8Q4D9_9AGAM|nr:ankyrin repeat-containing domain protein [Vararia minispora EC-137]
MSLWAIARLHFKGQSSSADNHLETITVLLENGAHFTEEHAWEILNFGYKSADDKSQALEGIRCVIEHDVDGILKSNPDILANALEGDCYQFTLYLLKHRALCSSDFLVLAARKGYEDIARIIIEKGMDPNSKDTHGDTALMVSIGRGEGHIMTTLLELGARWSPNELVKAARSSNLPLLERILWSGVDIDSGALVKKNRDVVDFLLDHEATCKSSAVLVAASLSGFPDIVVRALQNGTDVNARVADPTAPSRQVYNIVTLTALEAACEGRQANIANIILQHKTLAEIRPSDPYFQPSKLPGLCKVGSVSLIKHVFDIHTPISLSILNESLEKALEHTDIIEFLLQNGTRANLDILVSACRVGNLAVVQKLICTLTMKNLSRHWKPPQSIPIS